MSLLLLFAGGGTPTPTPTPTVVTTALPRTGMFLIRPKTIDDTTLFSSNITEISPAAWSGATTYAEGDKVSVGTDVYRSLFSGNLNNVPGGLIWWASEGVAYPAWVSTSIYATTARIVDPIGHRTYEALSGTGYAVTMTIASPCVVTKTAHGLTAGTPIAFNSGTFPTGITANTVYYVVSPTTNDFQVAATVGGAAINTSGTQSGTHIAFPNPNLNKAPSSNPTFWLDLGPTNKWAMFDGYNNTTTTHPYQIDVEMHLSGRVDSLALLNLINAVSARVVVSTDSAGVIYDQSYPLTSTDGITDWYSYYFEEIERKATLLVTDLPTYADPQVEVIIDGNGESKVECGLLSIGMTKDLGKTLHDGAQVGITDYSRKDVDAFGNYTIVKRAFAKRGSFQMRLKKSAVDSVHAVLSEFRATAAVYSASRDYGSTMIFGFFREFNIEIDRPEESLVSVEIEGLT